jgi:hypothetical protein
MIQRTERRVRQESPVRIFGMDGSGRAINVSAWTVDVSHHGARVRGVNDWSAPGETVGVRHGAEKARFRIVWVGEDGTPHQGQIGLLCVEAGKYIWGVSAPAASNADDAPKPASVTSMFHLADQVRLAVGLSPGEPLSDNRRNNPRYRAHGGAKIQEIGARAPQWATLHDLSLGGCYVETSDPLPPLSRVDVVVHINDIQITARGSVTVCHRLVGMGVKFTEITPLNRTRLEQVMAMLTQTSTES